MHGGVVRQQFDQQAYRVQGAATADESGKGGVDRNEGFDDQVVARTQVRSLVGQDCGEFRSGECRQGPVTQHHPASHSGQAVGQRFVDVQNTHTGKVVPAVAEQIDHPAVVGPATTGGDRHEQHGRHQASTNQQCQHEDEHRRQPQGPADLRYLAGHAGVRATIVARQEKPGCNGEPGAERGQHRRHRDRLPQHHSRAGSAKRPGGPGQQRRNRTNQQQRHHGEGQRGHA